MTTITDENYQDKVRGTSKHTKHECRMPETTIKIKQEKITCIKSEPINDYQGSERECGPKKVKTEPGTKGLHHHGITSDSSTNYACMELDPYSDDVIFMGIGTSKKSQFSSEPFKLNFAIKTEKKDYFVTPDGVCIIHDDSDEERAVQLDDNNNISVVDLTNDDSMIETCEKVVKQEDLHQDKGKDETNLTTNKAEDLNQDNDTTNEKEATNEQTLTTENPEEETSTASKTTRDEIDDQTTAKNMTQPKATPEKNKNTNHKASDDHNTLAPKNQTDGNLMLNRMGKINKNGKHLYLWYVKDNHYGNEIILVYIEEEDYIRMFTKEFEPHYFYIAFYDLFTSPKYYPPQWIKNFMHYNTRKALRKNKEDQEYMKTFKFNPKMVQYKNCLLWKVTEKNNQGIVVQDQHNCECIEIHDQNDYRFSQLDKIFKARRNSSIVGRYAYFNSMKRNFFYRIMS